MRVLVTGGAGFIGSNIVEALLKREDVTQVIVLDNFSTGFEKNIMSYLKHSKFNFIFGDITDCKTCKDACALADVVCHQAALGSVPRSIVNPQATHAVNVDGFFNMLDAARLQGISRFVYASSSSVYGDASYSPKVEDHVGELLSPYAVTKKTNELYANNYHLNYGMEVIGLRYFNVFGPKQDPNGNYAAVIPLFFKAALNNSSPKIYGDGSITRDFTYIENVVNANLNALTTDNRKAFGKVYNIACGHTTTLTQIWNHIKELTNSNAIAVYKAQRPGDILHSLADISLAKVNLEYIPHIDVEEGLRKSVEWHQQEY